MPLPPVTPIGVFTPWVSSTDTRAGTGIEAVIGQAPGNINPPIIFEPNPVLSGNKALLWIIGSGGANWGGAQVYVSLDDTTYTSIGYLIAGAPQGYLAAPFAGGSDPDTGNTLSVNLTESLGVIVAGTEADADFRLPTLCYCDGELVAFSAATLTSAHHYDLDTYIRRGSYGTLNTSHASGTKFAWIQNPYSYEYPRSLVGTTLYFKFPSFNKLGGGAQDLADCVAYTYTLTGFGLEPVTPPTSGGYMLPLVTGDTPGPVAIADDKGQFIGVPL